jgi:hypothetical protein
VVQYVLENILMSDKVLEILPANIVHSFLQIAFEFFFHYEAALVQYRFYSEAGKLLPVSKVFKRSSSDPQQIDLPDLLWTLSVKHRVFLARLETSPEISSLL